MTNPPTPSLRQAIPFWISLGLIPLAGCAAVFGGWALLLMPLGVMLVFGLVDLVVGQETANLDPETPNEALSWYRRVTLLWPLLQFLVLFGVLAYVTQTAHLSRIEEWALFVAIGFMNGAVGIVYAHELMHQKQKLERWLSDILMCMTVYGHFRSEHLLVHHRYVGTPRDPVTARYNENFYRFFIRVLWQCLRSAFRAERDMLARRSLPWWHRSNPFWRYWALEVGFLLLAAAIGGWWGVWLFLTQAFIAVLYLELVNYMEHYGLTREHLGEGRYEYVKPHHSWNSDAKVSNWLLINLQRHSDHHYKPDRRFPLLQTYASDEAPQLPLSYPIMGAAALIPPLWRRQMNPQVRNWRKQHYPHISDWSAYKAASNPMPR